MRIAIILSIGVLLLSAPTGSGQETLSGQERVSPKQTVSKKIEPGKTELFSITLNDGDYVNVSIGYKGKINFFIQYPDGTIVRRLIGSSNEGKVPFVFAAEGAGSYSFKIENPGDQSATYELAIGEVVSLNERLKPQPWTDPFPSPRIQSLRTQIAEGRTNTDRFWKQVAAEGTPLTEPFGSDGKYQLVTGGLAAPYVAMRHSDIFGNVLSLSGAFWWSFEHNGGVCGSRCPESGGRGGEFSKDATTEGNFLVKEFLARPKLPLRFYLTAGTFEIDSEGGGGAILESTRHLRDVLLAKGYEVHYQQFVGGHDGLSWRGRLADGLIALLGSRR